MCHLDLNGSGSADSGEAAGSATRKGPADGSLGVTSAFEKKKFPVEVTGLITKVTRCSEQVG